MRNDKLMYILIFIGIVIIFALGINIGLSLKKEPDAKIDLYKEVEKLDNAKSNEVTKNEPIIVDNPSQDEEPVSNETKTNSKESIKEETKINTSTSNSTKKTNTNTSTSTSTSLSLKDTKVITKLTDTFNKVKASVNEGTFKEDAKATFISLVDFLFYDGTIDGVTFKELTSEGKEKALDLINKIDNAIESKVPGYKDTINDKKTKVLNKASELIKKGTTSLDTFLKNKLDSDDYEELIRDKEELVNNTKNAVSFIKENGSTLWDSVKEKTDSWYQTWKNK